MEHDGSNPAVSDAAADLLDVGLSGLGLEVAAEQKQKLLGLADLLLDWGARINLTGHRDRVRIVGQLILDAAALLSVLPEGLQSLADLGSGAGFPGLPLAILRPGLQVTLIESRERKVHFQRAAQREFGLSNAVSRRGRAEELEPTPHGAAVAQAMAKPTRALEWMLPWVEAGGLILLPGGPDPAEEFEHPAVQFERLWRYELPGGGPRRSLRIGRRRA